MSAEPDWARRLYELERELRGLRGWRDDVSSELREWEEVWPEVLKHLEEAEVQKRVAVEIAKRDEAIQQTSEEAREARERRWKPWQRRAAVVVGAITVLATITQTIHAWVK